MPSARVSRLPFRACTFPSMFAPTTGNCASAEWISAACRSGRPLMKKPVTVASTTSNGKSEKKV